uniref:PIN domain-containing protein n=1 Tax=Anopheles farauti TaxID=69004 RepID=A0A182Q195_9DIPT
MSSKRNITATTRDKPPLNGSKTMITPNTSSSNPAVTVAMTKASKSSVLTPVTPVAKRLSVPIIAPHAITPIITKDSTASSSSRRYSAPNKIPDASSSAKLEKPLSTIVKAKSRKDKGLPVAWRKDLYGARPGSAQERLENLREALQKEVEEQKAKASTSKQVKCPPTGKSATDRKASLAFPDIVPSASTAPSILPDTTIATIATILRVPITSVEPENLESNHEMEVDDVEMESPNTTPSSPVATGNNSDSMDCDTFMEFKQTEVIKDSAKLATPLIPEHGVEKDSKDEEKKSDSQKLKTNYKNVLSAYSSCLFCVIDTSVFIEHYKDFESFLTKKYVGRQPIVVVPYKVLHELDTVKHKKPQLASNITPVVKFLHRMLRVKDARVKGQHPWDDTVELMPIITPDDSIINCALQVQSATDGSGADVSIVLVSNDCNMLTKALVANLNSCTMEELQKEYSF